MSNATIFAGASAILDIVEAAQWQEEDGLVTRIERQAIVRDLTPGMSPQDVVCQAALQLTTLPQPGDPHPHEPECILTSRVAKPLSTKIVSVQLIYSRPDTGTLPGPENWELSGNSSIQQIQTELDRSGDQILVAHEGVIQGGEITPFEAHTQVTLTAVLLTFNPIPLAMAYTNIVNNAQWQGGDARTWIVADVAFDRVKLVPIPQYRFDVTLRHNFDGWDPQVIYIDPETGRPPPGLIAGLGYKTIPWHAQADFEAIFF